MGLSRAASVALVMAALFAAPAFGGKFFNVGQPANNFNYAWNPIINAMQWAAAVKTAVGDTLGT